MTRTSLFPVRSWVSGGGFSLLELLITLAISAVLLLVALPGYQEVQRRSYRLLASAVLAELWAQQESYRRYAGDYATALTDLGLPDPYFIAASEQPSPSGRARYRLILRVEEGLYQGFAAQPVNHQLRDHCGGLTIDVLGMIAATGVADGERCH
ncbi:MAG: type IV pilin protein [Pseudomonadota bacterium]